MIDLANKKIILTGGSRGIGLSILNEIYKLKAKIFDYLGLDVPKVNNISFFFLNLCIKIFSSI